MIWKFIFVSFLVLVSAASKTNKNLLSKFEKDLKGWESIISSSSQVDPYKDVESLSEKIKLIKQDIPTVVSNASKARGPLERLYKLALRTIKYISPIYEFLDLVNESNTELHKLAADLYDFVELFRSSLGEEHGIDYLLKCLESIFTYGTNWTATKLLLDPKNESDLFRIINFTIPFLVKTEAHFDKDAVMFYYLNYCNLAISRGRIDVLVSESHPMAALLYIRDNNLNVHEHFRLWLRVFFRGIHTIFNRFENDTEIINILLEMAKKLDCEDDLDWVIGIFSAQNLFTVIKSTQSLQTIAVEILKSAETKFPKQFALCLKFLGSKRAEQVREMMQEQSFRKQQVIAAVTVRRLLPLLQAAAEKPVKEAYESYSQVLEKIDKADLAILAEKDNEIIGQAILNAFNSLYDTKTGEVEELLLLNTFVPIITKLGLIESDMFMKLQRIVINFIGNCSKDFATFSSREVTLIDVGNHLQNFHGVVFREPAALTLHLVKFTKHWKMNLFTLKVFKDLITNLNWYHHDILRANVQQRILKFMQENINSEVEQLEIGEIVEYLGTEIGILTKTEHEIYKTVLNK